MIITNVTLGKIRDEINRRNQKLYEIAESFGISTWDMISLDVKSGNASKYAIGSELVTTYIYNGTEYEFPWIVMDNDRECEWQDGSKHPGLWLCAKYTTPETIDFDAIEGIEATEATAQEGVYYTGKNGTTYTALNLSAGDAIPYTSYDVVYKGSVGGNGAYRDGYGRYRDSAVRQWLNSDAGVNEWWQSTHFGDNPPIKLDDYVGFMAGLNEDFVSAVTPCKISTAVDTSASGGGTDVTFDKFFLLSLEEVYGVAQIADVEGPYFPYWKTVSGLNSPSNSANDGRKLYSLIDHQTGRGMKLRSASKNTTYNVWQINQDGSVSNNVARQTWSVLPACVIS